ncbi:MAG TPA: TonB-dependent receptor plug domain-containing protein, partial [Gemmatimonadales bacterium]|nr:TonB-dependent receptor plug domain-containing protein [Gemmatimonadales bacterium]
MRAPLSLLCAIGVVAGLPPSLQGQAGRTLRGRVVAAVDSAPIADAVIRILEPTAERITHSSSAGRFELRAPDGPVRLLVARIGYAPDTLAVAPTATVVTVWLRESAFALDPITVAAEPTYSAASSRAIRELDILLRPRETAQELLRLAPGLVIAQHAGGGKAEQIFLRAFDVDHGTDVAVTVDGVPVNMVSHGHGQGYADLHFLTPEAVQLGQVRKGPYDAGDGNLATAGAIEFRTRDRIERAAGDLRAGTYNTAHGLAVTPFGGGPSEAGGYVMLSGHRTDGPTLSPQGYRRLNGFAKLTAPLGGRAEVVASASGFDSRWSASGQIPERAVESGMISRFGSIDDSEGGNTSRYDLTVGVRSTSGGERRWEARAYAVKYDFSLFSNFTFFLDNPLLGDGINQTDDRWVTGANGSYALPSRLFGAEGSTTVGLGVRSDWTDVGLRRSVRRVVGEPRVDAQVSEQHGYTWIRQDLRLAPAVRLQLGARADLFRFRVLDRLEGTPSDLPHASGTRVEGRVSPKANLAVEVSRSTTLFANLGAGFHSNDARGIILAGPGATVLPRALGAELGSRHVWTGGSLALAAWALDLESELTYVGDAGTTEPSGRTRRVGVDVEARVRLATGLWADADLNLSRGRFRDEPDGADLVPLAPTFTSTGGLTWSAREDLSAGARYRHIGERAADETGAIRALGSTLVELFASYRVGGAE